MNHHSDRVFSITLENGRQGKRIKARIGEQYRITGGISLIFHKSALCAFWIDLPLSLRID